MAKNTYDYSLIEDIKSLKTKKLLKKPRDRFELVLDLHNHKLELVRTVANVLNVCLQIFILLRVFGKL